MTPFRDPETLLRELAEERVPLEPAEVVLGRGFSATALLREPAPVASVQASIAGVEAVSGTLVLSHNGRARVVLPGEEPVLSAGDAVSTAADGSAKLRTERSLVEVS